MKHIEPCEVNGSINAPASKSMMQRAVAASLLAHGTSHITNASFCDDSNAALNAAKALGALVKMDEKNAEVAITGTSGIEDNVIINCNESGLSMRMFSAIASLFEHEITITGNGSLLTRPVEMIEKPLRHLGARCETNNGKLPIKITGRITGGKVDVDGSLSSQFITGLLIALPTCEKDSEITVNALKSKPYVDSTIGVVAKYGVRIENKDRRFETFKIRGNQKYLPTNYEVEGDWSGAAFMLVAGAIAGKVTVNNIQNNSLQADKAILNALKMAGAIVRTHETSVEIETSELNGFEFDATDCPDLFPPLVALALNCDGKTILHGVDRLKHKESDRADVLQKEFEKLGARLTISGNTMEIEKSKINGGEVDSNGDHRIAMACAVAALNSNGIVRIKNPECVAKSYPEFFMDLEKLRR